MANLGSANLDEKILFLSTSGCLLHNRHSINFVEVSPMEALSSSNLCLSIIYHHSSLTVFFTLLSWYKEGDHNFRISFDYYIDLPSCTSFSVDEKSGMAWSHYCDSLIAEVVLIALVLENINWWIHMNTHLLSTFADDRLRVERLYSLSSVW